MYGIINENIYCNKLYADAISGTGPIHSIDEFGDGTNYAMKWNPITEAVDISFSDIITHKLLNNGDIEITGELIESGTSSGTGEVDYYTKTEADGLFQTIQLLAAPNFNQSAEGPQCSGITAGEAITVMDCVYLHGDGKWHKTCAVTSSASDGMLSISLESKNEDQTMNVAMPGCFIRNDNWTWSAGEKIYLATTSGSLTQVTVSGTDEAIRIVGHATSTTKIFFNPDQTVIIHT